MIVAKDFSLRHTIESGQPLTFYANYSRSKDAETLNYVTMKGQVNISLKNGIITHNFNGDYSRKTAADEIVSRFNLNENIDEIYNKINTDEFIDSAIKEFYGMRITKNDPWEATLCFVISQFNNLKRIRGITNNMINKFGENSGHARLFPMPESIAKADISDIRTCGTGFRDKYIKSVAEEFAFSFDKNKLYKMDYYSAKEKLMELDGIGDKVADCILLFGYNKLEAFPIDTWVKRVMEHVYFNKRKKTIKRIHEFANNRWEKRYLGYVQQYIFWSGRENNVG